MLISRTASNFGEIPIGVDVLKRRLQIDDIPENDNELDSLLKEAVEAVERYTGVAIRAQQVTLVFDGWANGETMELPCGPIESVTGYPSTVTLAGVSTKTLAGYSYEPFTLVCQVRDEPVPEGLIGAVKQYVQNAWFRPEEKNVNWKAKAAPYRRPYLVI